MQSGDVSLLKERLVEEINRSVQDRAILNAFRTVSRHEFVDTFFAGSYTKGWQSMHPSDQQWLEKVYQNSPLITSLNSSNRPDVSSSQPDIMAKMIQSVRLQPGRRVLEIGTGTGYNAALLATIVGKQNVISIDVNRDLLDLARERLERTIGPGVTILHADGRNLPASLGIFDAIIVTASHNRVEPSWIRALAAGGRLILNWNKSLSKVFLELEREGAGLVGQVAWYSGDFMELHDGHGVQGLALPYQTMPEIAALDFRARLIHNFDFGFFLQVHIPSLTAYRYRGKSSGKLSYSVRDEKNRVVHFSSLHVTGDISLWKEIDAISQEFDRRNAPRRKECTLIVDECGGMTFYHDGRSIP